ncbi:MAG: alpha/beta hydrolase-fold protein [Flagellimonas sp.]
MKRVLIFLSFILISMPLAGQEIKIGLADSIKSNNLNEVRQLKIFLPASYDNYKQKRYPVTYVLDGGFLYHSVSGMVEYMTKTGQIPEMILVCISNSNRTRDFTLTKTTIGYEGEEDKNLEESGGADKFRDFMNTELLPYIDEKYRTNDFNTIIGRSFAGLFVAYDYLQEDSQLDRFLLIDPSLWWDDRFVLKLIDSIPIADLNKKKLYLSTSDNFKFSDDLKKMRESQESFYAALKDKGVNDEKIELKYFENESHGTVTIPSVYNGLTYIFSEYYLEAMKYRTANEIIEHFADFSRMNSADFPPLENMIQWLATVQITNKNPEGAEKLYKFNIKNYPESINAHLSLAKHYEKLGNRPAATQKYKDILTLDENNQFAIDKLEELGAN